MNRRSRGKRGIHRHEPHLLESDPEIPAMGHHLEHPGEQVIGIAEGLECLAIDLAVHLGHGLIGPDQHLGGLRGAALAQAVDGIQPQPQVLGRVAEEARLQAPGEQVAAGLLGVQQLPVHGHRGVEVRILVLDEIDLLTGAIQLAREDEEFEQEQPLRLVGGRGPDFLELGLDGLSEPTRLVEFTGLHHMPSSPAPVEEQARNNVPVAPCRADSWVAAGLRRIDRFRFAGTDTIDGEHHMAWAAVKSQLASLAFFVVPSAVFCEL